MIIAVEDMIITAVEGTGDNLLEEDIKEGYVDYLMTNVYKRDGYELVEEDGGQMMLYKLWQDYLKDAEKDDHLLPYKMIIEYWGFDPDTTNWVIIEP